MVMGYRIRHHQLLWLVFWHPQYPSSRQTKQPQVVKYWPSRGSVKLTKSCCVTWSKPRSDFSSLPHRWQWVKGHSNSWPLLHSSCFVMFGRLIGSVLTNPEGKAWAFCQFLLQRSIAPEPACVARLFQAKNGSTSKIGLAPSILASHHVTHVTVEVHVYQSFEQDAIGINFGFKVVHDATSQTRSIVLDPA